MAVVAAQPVCSPCRRTDWIEGRLPLPLHGQGVWQHLACTLIKLRVTVIKNNMDETLTAPGPLSVKSVNKKAKSTVCAPSSACVRKADHSTDKSDGPLPCAPVQKHPSSQILGRQNWRHQKHHRSSSVSWALMVTFKSYFNTENRYAFVVGLSQTLNTRWEEKDSSGITIWTLGRAPSTAHSSTLTRVF